MKKKLLFLLGLVILLPVCVVFADEAVTTVANVSSIAVPEGSPWYASIIAAIFPILLGALAWVSERVASFVSIKMKEVKTSEQNAWYSGALFLAGIAIKAAESRYPIGGANWEEVKRHASKFLLDRLVAKDSTFLKKNPNAQSLIDGLLDAMRKDASTALSPLAPAVATSSSTPSVSDIKLVNGAW